MKKTKRGATHKEPMKIVFEKPPIWDRAKEAFDLQGGEIFAWGDTI